VFKKIFGFMLIIFLLIGLLAACAPAEPNEPATEREETQQEVNIRFTSWDTAEMLEAYERLVELFSEAYPHINVSLESMPDGYEEKIFTSVAAGTAPDVFLWWNFPQLVAANAVESLDAYIGVPGGIDPELYYAEVLEHSKVDGKLYAIPNAATPRAMYFNKTIFDEAGVPYPEDDWTYDDFVDKAIRLTEGDIYGFVAEARNTYTLQQFIWTFGGQVISEDGETIDGIMNSEASAQALQWYADLVNEHRVSPAPSVAMSLGGGTEMFMTGKVAMFESGTWPIREFRAMEAEGFRVGSVMMPSRNGKRVGIMHSSGLVIARGTRNKDAAMAFVTFVGGEEGHRESGRMGFALPVMPSIVEELGLADDPLYGAFVRMVDYCTVTPAFMTTEHWSIIDAEFANAMEATILGQMTAQEALDQAVERAAEALEIGR